MVENAMAMVGVTQMRNRSDPVVNGPSDRFERKKIDFMNDIFVNMRYNLY